MLQINPYIHFDGTCRDAMTYYKECLGGEVTLQTVGESPMKDKMGPNNNAKVMHASLTKDGNIFLMGCDMMDPTTFVKGDNITISLNCTSEDEIKNAFTKLSAGGKIQMPLKEEFWGALFGAFTDKFGIDWMVNFDKSKKA